MYAGVEDKSIHFRLLHATDHAPVEQRIVRKSNDEPVPKSEWRKAFPLDDEDAVILQPDEIDAIEPAAARDITLCRFVPLSAVSHQWYERPYYLGPDDDAKAYFALAQAMTASELVGVARWAMRSKRYVGGLRAVDGYLALITFRRSDQIIAGARTAETPQTNDKELQLAQQLIAHVAGDFDPGQWKNEYRERVRALIEAKARGKKIAAKSPRRKAVRGGLSEQLRRSLASLKERKVA
jgi:DNA end-binding protein Ku